jgi:tetratricopeptide (TPR) repeat protein
MRSLALAAVTLAACMPSPAQLAMNQVGPARAQAHQRPGPRQAQAYADAIDSAYKAGSYQQNPRGLQLDVDDAAWKALLFVDAGRFDDGLHMFEASQQMAPNLMAAKNLVVIYGAANLPQKVGLVCAATVPIVVDLDDKYWLVGHCNKNMNAISDEAAMSWASPDTIAWYQQERARRAQVAQAQAEQDAQREAYQRRVVSDAHVCADRCNQRGYQCEARCGEDQQCRDDCVDADHACVQACADEGNGRMGY